MSTNSNDKSYQIQTPIITKTTNRIIQPLPVKNLHQQQQQQQSQQSQQFSFTSSLYSVYRGLKQEFDAFVGSAVEFDNEFLESSNNLNLKRNRNETSEERKLVELQSTATKKRRKEDDNDNNSRRSRRSRSRSNSKERDLFIFTEPPPPLPTSQANVLAQAYEKSASNSTLATSSSGLSTISKPIATTSTTAGMKSLSGKRVLPSVVQPSKTTAPINTLEYSRSNLKPAPVKVKERVESILMGGVGDELHKVWNEAKEVERRKKDQKRIDDLEDQVRALKEQLSKKSNESTPLRTTALNFFKSPFKSSVSNLAPPPPPPPPPAPPLPPIGFNRPDWRRGGKNELLEDARAALKSTPKKSIQGRRLSAIGPPGGIDAGGIDMGAFLDEMKGVKLKKVSDAVKKERELSFKSKGKNEDEITAVLQRAFQKKFAAARGSPATPSLIPRSQSLNNLSSTTILQSSRINTSTANSRAYQSSSMAFDNHSPTKSNLSKGTTINYGQALSADVAIPVPISIPSGTVLVKKPRRSFSGESENDQDPPPSPSVEEIAKQNSNSNALVELELPRISSLPNSSGNGNNSRALDSRPRLHPTMSEKISKPTTPGRKEKKLKKRFSTLPYTYSAASPEKKNVASITRHARSRSGSPRKMIRDNVDEEKEGTDEVEHGDLIGFGVKLQQEDH